MDSERNGLLRMLELNMQTATLIVKRLKELDEQSLASTVEDSLPDYPDNLLPICEECGTLMISEDTGFRCKNCGKFRLTDSLPAQGSIPIPPIPGKPSEPSDTEGLLSDEETGALLKLMHPTRVRKTSAECSGVNLFAKPK